MKNTDILNGNSGKQYGIFENKKDNSAKQRGTPGDSQ